MRLLFCSVRSLMDTNSEAVVMGLERESISLSVEQQGRVKTDEQSQT
jgi:hypothetical protein